MEPDKGIPPVRGTVVVKVHGDDLKHVTCEAEGSLTQAEIISAALALLELAGQKKTENGLSRRDIRRLVDAHLGERPRRNDFPNRRIVSSDVFGEGSPEFEVFQRMIEKMEDAGIPNDSIEISSTYSIRNLYNEQLPIMNGMPTLDLGPMVVFLSLKET